MQSRTSVTGLNPPRIYCIAPATIADAAERERTLAHASDMQFDTILLCHTGALASPEQDETFDDADSDRAIAALAADCAQRGLRLLLDLELDCFAPAHALPAQHADQFFKHHDGAQTLPDPRIPHSPTPERRVRLRLDAAGIELALSYWQARVAGWLDAGVAGFRCLDIARIPPALWQKLIARSKQNKGDADFLAWTPGCTPEQLQAVQDCGFDAVFASDAWWDYRAGWLVEEQARLAQIAPRIIAAPEDPQGMRLLRSLHADDPALAQCAYRRALQAAALIADGLMLVQGFEYGAETALCELQRDRRWAEQPAFNLSLEIANTNRRIGANRSAHAPPRMLSAPGADIALLLRPMHKHDGKNNAAFAIMINADLHRAHVVTRRMLRERAAGWIIDFTEEQHGDEHALTLPPGAVHCYRAQMPKPVTLASAGGKAAVTRAARVPRVAIEHVMPSVDCGRFPVKRIVGDTVTVEADIFGDGHDHIAGAVLWRAADEIEWCEARMEARGNDRWSAPLPLQRIGRYVFVVEAWRDNFDTYRDELDKKTHAGLDVTLEIQEGRQLIEKTIAGQAEDSTHVDRLKKLLQALPKPRKKAGGDNTAAIALLLSSDTAALMRDADLREFATRSAEYRIESERQRAGFSSWYELFPRSQSGDAKRHGTFDDVIARLPAVRDMGFDTLYFPPIHPIGRKNMKGRNNSLTPTADDPGSPYAIGSEAGGHDAIHPQLGTLDDFRRLVAAAREHGMEIALDFAIQCSPDHPWLQDHPDWFAWRPDGSLRYAENPPKKYEDIVNVDFYAEAAIPSLWIALRDVVLLWVREGVRTFRVDNPHTKPLPFWEWMINDVRAKAPDVIFLSEAFTRPKPMYRLAKLGFSQSYTYFTWRHSKQEFTDYLTELTTTQPAGGPREFFRPHFFVNTPDINPVFLQQSGRPGHLIRAALAATLSGLWGVYSGFELCEARAVTGKEEYLDSEKYEIRAWDWNRPGNIVREIAMLNRIRKGNPALHTHLNVRFQHATGDQILYFSKATRFEGAGEDRFGDNVLLVAINLDPFAAHEATIDVPLWQFGLPDHGAVDVEELMTDSRFTWHGRHQQVRLDPKELPFAIWRVRPAR
ncbi:MAG TPA: maltotransferase domain-containing protein [Oxalicibacterium sp.]|nr:maltotransferase domain-containing protein [Oxalicibacterium sp.]